MDSNVLILVTYSYRLIALIIAFTIHGFTKAFVSTKLGDELPTREGRLTLNPAKHLDTVGLLIGMIFGIGWSKAVNVTTGHYSNRKAGTILANTVPMAANLIVGFLFSILSLILKRSNANLFVTSFLDMGALINVSNAIFNLLPMKPLDGNELLKVILPIEKSMKLSRSEPMIQIVVMFLMMFGVLPSIIISISNILLPNF